MYGTAWRLITAVLTTTVHTYIYVRTYIIVLLPYTCCCGKKEKYIFKFYFLFCLSIGEKMIGKKVYFLRED